VGPFLRGFADELIKVAQTDWSSVTRPPSTATGTERAPRPSNMLGPSNAMLRAIPKQRMESPAAPAQQTWRPSPGYRPNPASDPKPAPIKPRKGGVSRPSNAQPAWETSQQMHARKAYEASYNRGRAGGPMPASMQNAPGLGESPRPLTSTERAYVAGRGAPKIQPVAPGGLRKKSPLEAAGFRPPQSPGSF